MRRFGVLAAGALSACVPAIAPPAQMSAIAPHAALDRPVASATLTGGNIGQSAISLQRAFPMADVPPVVIDLGGHAGPYSGGFSSGVWLRTPGPKTRFGVRLGATAGTGDLFGSLPWAMPWGGPSLHLQLAHGWQASRAGVTLGFGWMEPILPTRFSKLSNPADPTSTPIRPIRGTWTELDLRWEAMPEDGSLGFVFGVSVDAFLYVPLAPSITVGVVWHDPLPAE